MSGHVITRIYDVHMVNKRQIGIKFSEDLIAEIDEVCAMLDVPPTRTAFIEQAVVRLIRELRAQRQRPDNVVKMSK